MDAETVQNPLKIATPQEAQAAYAAIAKAIGCARQNQWNEAIELLAPHLGDVQNIPEGCYLYGAALLHQNNAEGMQWLHRCQALKPDHAASAFSIGVDFFKRTEYANAQVFLERVVKSKPDHVQGWLYLAHTLLQENHVERALEAYHKVESLAPETFHIQAFLSRCYLALDEREIAKERIERALESYPEDAEVIYNYTLVHSGKMDDARLERFSALFESRADLPRREQLAYALAIGCEARRDSEKAFHYYKQANSILSAKHPYDVTKDIGGLAPIVDAVSSLSDKARQESGSPEEGAVFVVGLARSGTTLMQQILSAHSKVSGVGELYVMRNLMATVTKKTQKQYPHFLEHLNEQSLKNCGDHYMQVLRSYADTPYIVDKMPSNFYLIPFIRMMIPNAKIICMQRDPIDTCWSLWRQNFRNGHQFRYRFEDLAYTYDVHHKIETAYKQQYGDELCWVSYEQLTTDPENEIRRVMNYIGLEWEDALLKHHTQKQRIRTSSINQVNQAINVNSQRSWLPVEEQLKPLINALHQYDIETCVSRGEVEL